MHPAEQVNSLRNWSWSLPTHVTASDVESACTTVSPIRCSYAMHTSRQMLHNKLDQIDHVQLTLRCLMGPQGACSAVITMRASPASTWTVESREACKAHTGQQFSDQKAHRLSRKLTCTSMLLMRFISRAYAQDHRAIQASQLDATCKVLAHRS